MEKTKVLNKHQKKAWYFYDWANSAYTTTVITVFLGPYLTSIANNAANNGYLNILGMNIFANSLFAYVISISVLFQFLIMPPVSAIADKLGNNKFLMGLFAYLGAFATILMYYLNGDNYIFGSILLIISNVAFGTSVVLYNSFLTYISNHEDRDSTSSKGWAVGYLGAAVFLGLNLFFVQNAEKYGFTMGEAVRICLMTAGIWWAVFTIIPLWGLKSLRNSTKLQFKHIFSSFQEIKSTLKSIRTHKITFQFLIAYLLYNDGIQAVIALAATFGSIELKLGNDVLISAILLVQFVAFIGSILFNYLSKYTSNKIALLIGILIWTFAIVYAYGWLYTETGFYILSIIIGLVLGGTQSISRSVFSQLIPYGKEAEYFSFYELTDRGTSWLGTMFFALSLQFTNSYRFAILSLILFFFIGLILLYKTDIKKGIEEIKLINGVK